MQTKKRIFDLFVKKYCLLLLEMSETEAGSGLFSMPTLQYNEEGWGPIEISEDFRVMPYQVICRFFFFCNDV